MVISENNALKLCNSALKLLMGAATSMEASDLPSLAGGLNVEGTEKTGNRSIVGFSNQDIELQKLYCKVTTP